MNIIQGIEQQLLGGNMTWEELKIKAIEMGAEVREPVFKNRAKEKIIFRNLVFWGDGLVGPIYNDVYGESFTQDRTPEQMLMIMRGLE